MQFSKCLLALTLKAVQEYLSAVCERRDFLLWKN